MRKAGVVVVVAVALAAAGYWAGSKRAASGPRAAGSCCGKTGAACGCGGGSGRACGCRSGAGVGAVPASQASIQDMEQVPDGKSLYAFLLFQIPDVVEHVPCRCCGKMLAECYRGACPPT